LVTGAALLVRTVCRNPVGAVEPHPLPAVVGSVVGRKRPVWGRLEIALGVVIVVDVDLGVWLAGLELRDGSSDGGDRTRDDQLHSDGLCGARQVSALLLFDGTATAQPSSRRYCPSRPPSAAGPWYVTV
jgi:hypothetical protein